MKKKILLFVFLLVGGTIGVFSIVQANMTTEEAKRTPCRKHLITCPSGWCCGYSCSDGIPTLPQCLPNECQYYQPCLER